MSYVSNIADSLRSHSGNAIPLGPDVYTAIAEWEKDEIPLAIVLVSIEELCRNGRDQNGGFVSIDRFQSVVARNFMIWLSYGNAGVPSDV